MSRVVVGPYSMLADANQRPALKRRRNKFNAKRTTVDGIEFHSKREAARYKALKLLEASGRIRGLKRQIRYEFLVNGVKVGTYKSDFEYEEYEGGDWVPVVEDSKGYRPKEWPRTRKLMLACHGIEVRET